MGRMVANTTRYGDSSIFDAATGPMVDSIPWGTSSTEGLVCVAP